MTGCFLNGDTFAINVLSPAYTKGVKYGSTLVGHIIESQNATTQIRTKAKPSPVLYFLFFASLLFGLAYFYKFTQTGSSVVLLWSLATLIIGRALSIGFSNVAIASVLERYKMYIDKELNSRKTL